MRFLAPYQGIILSFVRIVVAYMFMLHGLAKAFGFPMAMGEGPLDWASMSGVAAILELVGGGLLILGLFTRPLSSSPGRWQSPISWCTPNPRCSSRW